MPIAVVTLKLSLAGAHSLKEKRTVIKSLKERLRRSFNISVAETDLQDVWQSAELTAAAVSPDKRMAEAVVSKVVDFARADREAYLVSYEVEVF
jgi:hypothetical protein